MKTSHFITVFFSLLFSFSQGQNISYPWYWVKEHSEKLSNALQNRKEVLIGGATATTAAATGTGMAVGTRPIEQIPMQAFTPVENEIVEEGEEIALATGGAGAIYVAIVISGVLITSSIGTMIAAIHKGPSIDWVDVKYLIWKSNGQEICKGMEKIQKSEVSNWDHLKEKCLLQPGDSYFIRITDLNGKKVLIPPTKILID